MRRFGAVTRQNRKSTKERLVAEKKLYGLIDEPSPFDTLTTWEHHLTELEALPDDYVLKPQLLAWAREMIAKKRSGQDFSQERT
jgi:hypothetical protein